MRSFQYHRWNGIFERHIDIGCAASKFVVLSPERANLIPELIDLHPKFTFLVAIARPTGLTPVADARKSYGNKKARQ
jgi:hypothetical protein